ncbi:MAG: addiction module protein [Desulfobacterales bacterium]|nr:addiction module protein [Desulfobacterales bacterium]
MAVHKKLIDEVLSLPVEERVRIAATLLESLNVPNPAIDKKWAAVAKRRLEELRSGKVKPIPGDEVFERVQKRFSK